MKYNLGERGGLMGGECELANAIALEVEPDRRLNEKRREERRSQKTRRVNRMPSKEFRRTLVRERGRVLANMNIYIQG